jgi:hypothetical protein
MTHSLPGVIAVLAVLLVLPRAQAKTDSKDIRTSPNTDTPGAAHIPMTGQAAFPPVHRLSLTAHRWELVERACS